jgi:hypothetical protein
MNGNPKKGIKLAHQLHKLNTKISGMQEEGTKQHILKIRVFVSLHNSIML